MRVDPLVEVGPLDRWHGKGIVLAGDAAHAGLPGLWQGVGLAMADAYAVGDRLRGADSIPGALEAYETDRKPIADLAARRSRQLLRLSTLERPPGRQLRNWLVRSLPGRTTHGVRRRLAAVG
ncbi:MAG: FAD-dependent oxidoreductase [Halobacteriales archaeon]